MIGVLRTPIITPLNNFFVPAPFVQERVNAIADRLSSWERPVVTDYELGVLLCQAKPPSEDVIEPGLYKAVVEQLVLNRLITPSKDFKSKRVFHLFRSSKPLSTEVACAVDPFACVTHLSAMEIHGITDRFSKILYLTTPPDSEWKELAQDKMSKDLDGHFEVHRLAKLPKLRPIEFERLEGKRVELMRRSSRGAFKVIKTPAIRVAMVGRTFLDMVREPENCGGMQHVVDTYVEYGSRYLSVIVEEIERHGKPIEKVRAGYLLDEVCKLHHPLIDGWRGNAQRGGSRMLDPKGEYDTYFSEKWMLSINVPSLTPDDATGEDA